MTLLARIKGGDMGDEARSGMAALAEALLAQGADAIVAGCTEVPLVLGEADVAAPFVDSAAVLADRTVAFGLGAWTPTGATGPSAGV